MKKILIVWCLILFAGAVNAEQTNNGNVFIPGVYHDYEGNEYIVDTGPLNYDGISISTIRSNTSNKTFNASWIGGSVKDNPFVSNYRYSSSLSDGISYGTIGDENFRGFCAGHVIGALQSGNSLMISAFHQSNCVDSDRGYNSLVLTLAGQTETIYQDSEGNEYIFSTGGLTDDGRTLTTITTKTIGDYFNASWITGPVEGHPLISTYRYSSSLLEGFSYGTVGDENFRGFCAGHVIGALQSGNSLMISAFHQSNCVDSDRGYYNLVLTRTEQVDGGTSSLAPVIINSPNPIINISDDNFKVEIGLDPGNESGTNSDWWLVADTPSGLFSYDIDSGTWVPDISVTYQDSLFSFDLFDFMNISSLPNATFTLYFGIDTLMNGALDMEQAHYDSVEVNSFVWPVDNHKTMSNPYAAFDVIDNGKYHSGFDLTSKTGSKVVRAAAAGIMRAVPDGTIGTDDDNHDMGNVIIIGHNDGKGPFTLYAHLNKINLEKNGKKVKLGEEIGEMGNTGCNDDVDKNGKPDPCGVHLHFELKQWGVLGNLHDDLGPVWGYTPTEPPNLYGYINPWPYLENSIERLNPIAVQSTVDQIVRTGPNSVEYKKVVGNIDKGDKYVAFARYGNWYQIYFPSLFGPATGWIQAVPEPSATIRQITGLGAVGLSVCNTDSACSGTDRKMSSVWEQQWIVEIEQSSAQDGCDSPWIKIFLDSDEIQNTGWVCGDYVDLN